MKWCVIKLKVNESGIDVFNFDFISKKCKGYKENEEDWKKWKTSESYPIKSYYVDTELLL